MPTYYNLVSMKLADQLEDYIAEQRLQPGDKLLAERKLCLYFGVSRMTVRDAIRHLSNEGVLEQRHGSGTYLAGPRRQRNISEASLSPYTGLKEEEIFHTNMLGIDRHKAGTQISWKMRWDRDESTYRIKMLHTWAEHAKS